MKKAIEDEVLCEYDYHPIFFNLNSKELEVYQEYTRKLRPHINSKTGRYKNNKFATALLIQRKHVIHKAVPKTPKIRFDH